MLSRVMMALSSGMLAVEHSGAIKLVDSTALAQRATIDTINAVLNWLNIILIPVFSVAATIGMIYVIVIAVKMARADNAEQREEAKKKIIYTVVGIGIAVLMILLLVMLRTNLSSWLGLAEFDTWVDDKGVTHLYKKIDKIWYEIVESLT